jgi:hypothetical protein
MSVTFYNPQIGIFGTYIGPQYRHPSRICGTKCLKEVSFIMS